MAPVIVGGGRDLGLRRVSLRGQRTLVGRRRRARRLSWRHRLAERFPVPVEGMDAGGVTLGFVFAVSAIVLLGWPAA